MKLRSSYVCQQCGYESAQWYGKCPGCGAWNSLVETVKVTERGQEGKRVRQRVMAPPQRLSEVKHIETSRIKSEFIEFDRVMGGGIVEGSVTLLAGDPGIGKSTLLLHILGRIGGLYVAGEESAEQVKLRAKRLGVEGKNIDIIADTSVESIVEAMRHGKYKTVIVDSIQTISSDELDGMPGSVGQVRYSAEALTHTAKEMGIAVIIIGHVTKEGSVAGPKTLEHMVDTVLFLEGERFANARILRTLKNRFGAVEEVGIFEMGESGLTEIDNPSALFLQDRVKNVAGSAVTVVMEGTRPILVEIQALVVPSQLAVPRRVANGIDFNRLQMLVAIAQKRLNAPLGTSDIYVNVSGGLKIGEPAADLAVILAIISSFQNKIIHENAAVFGEVGLLGEIRRVTVEERRVKEAQRLGYTDIISPKSVRSIQQIRKYLLAEE